MIRRVAVMLFASLSLLVLVTAVGVRDGDEPTFQEYFERLDELLEDSQSRLAAVDSPAEDESLSEDEETIDTVQAFFAAFPSVLRDLVDGLSDVTPRAETEDAHRELVVAGTAFLMFYEDLTSELAEADSPSERAEAIDVEAFRVVRDRFDQSCFSLQSIADTNAIDVDLGCATR